MDKKHLFHFIYVIFVVLFRFKMADVAACIERIQTQRRTFEWAINREKYFVPAILTGSSAIILQINNSNIIRSSFMSALICYDNTLSSLFLFRFKIHTLNVIIFSFVIMGCCFFFSRVIT